MNNKAFDIIYEDTKLITKISKLTNFLKNNDNNLEFISAYILNNREILLASMHGDEKLENISMVKEVLNTSNKIISDNKKEICIPFKLDDNIIFLLFIVSKTELDIDAYKSLANSFSKTRKKYNKNFLSDDGLINLLKNKNLKFEDEKKAKSYLSHTSYYQIKDFAYVFMNNNKYRNDISFDDIRNRIDLDKILRFNLLSLIEVIEISIKCNFAKILSEKGPLDYLNFEWCHKKSIKGVLYSIDKARDLLKKDDTNQFINLYKQKYLTDDIPILMLMEKFTLGTLNDFVDSSQEYILEDLSKLYDLGKKDFLNYLNAIKELRNRAAHNNNILDFLYNNKYKLETVITYIEHLFNIINEKDIFNIEKEQLKESKKLIGKIKY